MDLRLDGKVALVTGASRGIGKGVAKAFVDAGARVVLTSRKQDQLEATAAEIGGETLVVAANTGDPDAGRQAVAATLERFGALDILVNNAATNPYFGATLEVDESRFDKTFQVNLRGPLFWSQAAWKAWMSEHPGVIVNVASVGGMRAEYGLGVYNVTKAALIHLTRQLASELGPTRVVGVAPGLIRTDFSKLLIDNFGDKLQASLPTKRLGEPEDVANLVLFLCSGAGSWITGETFVVDGGAGVRSVA